MSIKSKLTSARRNSKYRLSIIIFLIILAGIIFYFVKNGTVKIILGAVIALLMGAGAMEITGNDYDILTGEKITKAANGFWQIGDDCTENTLNCADFQFQEDAQDFFESCGGKTNNVNRLDGNDHDGLACESLPHKPE